MSEPANRTSILCPFCGQRSTKHICARCALTTAEERDAARAEVARLTDVAENLKAKLTLHESEVAGRVATLTAALHLIAKTDRIPHPEHAAVSLTAHSAVGHQRCQAIALATLKTVQGATNG